MIPDPLFVYLKSWEKYSATPYYATRAEQQKGIATIGYGETYKAELCPPSITEAKAEEMLLNKIVSYRKYFTERLPQLKENEMNAIISMAYNLGLNGFPKLLMKIMKHENKAALLEFYDAINQQRMPVLGLIYRRACDAQIFEKGIYEMRRYITSKEKLRFITSNASKKEEIKSALATLLASRIKIFDEVEML